MKIIHLSDLHLKPSRFATINRKFKKIITRLNESDFDGSELIVITGDLIESALQHNSMESAHKLIGLLQEKFNNIMICSGNHDFGNFWGGDLKYMKPFYHIFSEFMTSNTTVPDDVAVGTKPPGSPFPIVNIFGNHLFIGLDSMEGEFEEELKKGGSGDWNWWAEGKIGKRQRDLLEKILEENESRDLKAVVYLHHHPYRKNLELNRLRDVDKFNPIVKDKVGLLLFGHNHYYQEFKRGEDGFDEVDLALEGGSIKTKGDIKFRIIDYSEDKPKTSEITIPFHWYSIFGC